MTVELSWKVGFEIELMAPRGSSREALAERAAERAREEQLKQDAQAAMAREQQERDRKGKGKGGLFKGRIENQEQFKISLV